MMSSIQPDEIELRLLRVLDALLETNNVTRAAALLGVTPSAVSHSLRELRHRMSDPLLVRSGSRLKPTPRALAIRPVLREALSELHRMLVQPPEFDPRTTTRRFTLAVPDHIVSEHLAALIPRLMEEAPQASVELRPIAGPLSELLESGTLDLVLTTGYADDLLALNSEMMRVRVLAEPFVCIARPNHPALVDGKIDVASFVECPQILINLPGAQGGITDKALHALGLKRRVALVLPSATAAVQYVANSNLIATVPLGVASRGKADGLVAVVEPPIELPLAVGFLWWHPRFHREPAHMWWREMLTRFFHSPT
jgi:DNA-binding transcriptional LysR family regulator